MVYQGSMKMKWDTINRIKLRRTCQEFQNCSIYVKTKQTSPTKILNPGFNFHVSTKNLT